MSTSKKLRVKLAKHRHSPRKAARKEPEPEPAESSTEETQASTERGTVTALSALTGTQFVCFCHWLSGQKLFAGLSLFTCTFQSLRRARRAHRDRRRLERLRAASLGHRNAPREPPQQVGRVKSLDVCLSHSLSGIWPNTNLIFIPQLAAPGKGSAKPPPLTLTARRSPHQTATPHPVDTSTSEGVDEKDFILPDYPSDELTSSESSESKPEEALAENHSMGWSERVTQVDTQFHGDHIGPQNIPDHINHESTTLSFLELFLDADFWGLLCHQTNLRAKQVKQSKPASYFTKNFKPIAVPDLKAFLGLRLQMEKCVIKPQYESYWQGAGHNFIMHTPDFREVIERDRFIALTPSCTWSIRGMRPWTSPTRFTKSGPCSTECSLSFAATTAPPATQPRRGHDSHQEPPRHQAVLTRQASQMGHQELPAVRDGIHPQRRNLHGPGQGPPLAPPRISRQCCLPSRGELAGHQQEPHAVHGPLLQLRCALPPAEE